MITSRIAARALPQFAAALGLSLVAFASQASVINSGGATIPGTFSFDFDTGVVPASFALGDIFWEQMTATKRQLGSNRFGPAGAAIQGLGFAAFAGLSEADLVAMSYDDLPLSGSDVGNVLIPNYVFAVRTNAGNYAKAVVAGPFVSSQNNGLQIRWVTYDGQRVPEPQTAALVLLALGAARGARWQQQRSASAA